MYKEMPWKAPKSELPDVKKFDLKISVSESTIKLMHSFAQLLHVTFPLISPGRSLQLSPHGRERRPDDCAQVQRAAPQGVPQTRPRQFGWEKEEEQRRGDRDRDHRWREPRRLLLLGWILRPFPHVNQLSDGGLEATAVKKMIGNNQKAIF